MLVPVLAVYLLAAATPPTIVRTGSSPACTELRRKTGVAIAGLIANDKLISRGKAVVRRMAHDLGPGGVPAKAELDTQNLDMDVSQIVSNLATIDRLLQGVQSKGLRAKLQAVRDAQAKNLNIFGGTSQTYEMESLASARDPLGGMVGDTENGMTIAGNPLSSESVLDDLSAQHAAALGAAQSFSAAQHSGGTRSVASLNQRRLLESIAAQEDATAKSDRFLADSPFLDLYDAVTLNQAAAKAEERPLSIAVIKAAAACSRQR